MLILPYLLGLTLVAHMRFRYGLTATILFAYIAYMVVGELAGVVMYTEVGGWITIVGWVLMTPSMIDFQHGSNLIIEGEVEVGDFARNYPKCDLRDQPELVEKLVK